MSSNEKKYKLWQIGVGCGLRNPLMKFWDPSNISETAEARNFKFGTKMDDSEY